MAWPKLRNRRSAVPPTAFVHGGGVAADRARPEGERPEGAEQDKAPAQGAGQDRAPADGTGQDAAAADRAGTPSWAGQQGWADSHATVAPSPADSPETADPLDTPFWASWAPADESIELDEPGDGIPADGPADDAVADADPRPRPLWEAVVAPVGGTGEQPKAEGIGQRLGNISHLSTNPRRRAWQRRAIVAVIAGLIAGILLKDWRWGLTFAVLAAIADTIIRSRTVYNGPAGVRLTRAQKNTLRQLNSLERKGYRAMHLVPLPNSEEQIDHLLIGPAGVFAIDSMDWDKRIPVRSRGHRQLWHGASSMNDRLEHAHWEADQAAELLSAATGRPVNVRATMAVYGPRVPWTVLEIRDVDVFSGPHLRKYLRRRARRRDLSLSPSEVERIEKAARTVFPQAPSAEPASR